jgi:UDPglucose 6-dehydrogenase
MKVLVAGSWHLALVTATGVALRGHQVELVPEEELHIEPLSKCNLPIEEPGLTEAFSRMLDDGSLRVTSFSSIRQTVYDVVWIAVDTPVDDDDVADPEYVVNFSLKLIRELRSSTVVIFSSQLPVGTLRFIEQLIDKENEFEHHLVAVPENLRLGSAMQNFLEADRLIVGIRNERALDAIKPLLLTLCPRLVVMSIESSEMVKHALNSFLATSIAFANQVAYVCEVVGADAHEVSQGVMSDTRVGPGAYLKPGEAFAGGTLARDLRYLDSTLNKTRPGERNLFHAVLEMNSAHKQWTIKSLERRLPKLDGSRILIIGLTYKAGTSTLRRSTMVELTYKLLSQNVLVTVAEKEEVQIPEELEVQITRISPAEVDVSRFDAVILGPLATTIVPEILSGIGQCSPLPLIVDPMAIIRTTGIERRENYITVGFSPTISLES